MGATADREDGNASRTVMQSRLRLQIFAVLVSMFSAAGCTPDIVFVSDEYFDEIVIDEEFASRVDAIGRSQERRIQITIVGGEDAFLPPDPRNEPECYVFAPILRDVGISHADTSEAVVFVFGDGAVGELQNVVTLSFDRVDAYRLAGVEAARIAQEGEEPSTVGALVLTDDATRRDEYAAFLEGFETQASRIQARQFAREPRREELRSAVRDMTTRGVDLLLVSVGSQNAFVLELLSGHAVKVITEDAVASGGFADHVVLSIERSVLDALESVVRACGESPPARLVVPATLESAGGTESVDPQSPAVESEKR